MGETANIAKMADILSNQLFSVFGWQRVTNKDHNFPCEDSSHKLKTHPTDVVFFYDEPYEAIRTYLNCDLKSYSKDTIKASKIHKAIVNLSKSVACAEKSIEWQDLHIHKGITPAISGLLFIYNHDGEYDANFQSVLNSIKPAQLFHPKESKIFVLGPPAIHWLRNVQIDINLSRAENLLPRPERCQFLYPDLDRRKLIHTNPRNAATLECLTSPWIMIESQSDNGTREGLVVYYREDGSCVEEFAYLLDLLLRYNLVHSGVPIKVKALRPHSKSSATFELAKQKYVDDYNRRIVDALPSERDVASSLKLRLDAISFETMTNISTEFNDTEIGMK